MFIIKPVVDMRKTASEFSEVVSQALFGEKVSLFQAINDWSLIVTPDGYLGWVPSYTLLDSSESYTKLNFDFIRKNLPHALDETEVPNYWMTCRSSVHLYAKKEIRWGPFLTLPFGIFLKIVSQKDFQWMEVELPNGDVCFVQKGNLSPFSPLAKKDLSLFSHRFLGIPYTWGGRSSFGYDCSGFVQMLYGQMLISLPRDSSDQERDPRLHKVEAPEPGDLVFFGNGPDLIQHVGLCLGEDQFIHATMQENKPWIRVSSLSSPSWNQGIYSYRVFKSL
jgi:hypothetical protein